MEKFKVHSLTGCIDMKRMHKAFKRVKRNRGVPGYDKQSIQMFEANLEQNLTSLMKQLKTRGQYYSRPLKRVYIPKGKNKLRPLGIPTVRDRVAQEVIRSLIEPIFDPDFSDFSYGFRPNRNAHQAVEKILEYHKQGFNQVADADIKGFFDNIPLELMIDLVAEKIADGNILLIIRRFLTADIDDNGSIIKSTKGTPQGGVISPLLANIVLDVLDKRLAQTKYKFVRYADDFVVLCRNHNDTEQALNLVKSVVQTDLELTLAPDKTVITNFRKGFDFLGFHITAKGVRVRGKSVDKFKDNIRNITKRSHNFDENNIKKLNRVIKGFANYFATKFSTVTAQFNKLDNWIRKRLRCMKTKRISKKDNFKIKNKYLRRVGLVFLADDVARVKRFPNGQFVGGRPVRERRMLVNIGN